jgi:hypothetical protein
MAGSFGFARGDPYDVSMKCGELALLPAVRSAPRDALIVTDGFSCREQIAQATHRRALHSAQVLQMALREGPEGPEGELPETRYAGEEATGALRAGLWLAGGALAAGVGFANALRRIMPFSPQVPAESASAGAASGRCHPNPPQVPP